MAEPKDGKKSYSHTVHLPKTRFPMKGELPKTEPNWIEFWEKTGVYRKGLDAAAGRPAFVLHDGPPYANGAIHIGHSLNKTLKDMTVKSQALLGRRASFVPGWDCHGLPIEHALLKEQKRGKRSVTDLNAFRRDARAFAQRFVDQQRSEFRRLGVSADWDAPYTTMSNAYEAAILSVFRTLVREGYVYRGLKTVSWCVHCETALAEAEVEYQEKTSPSVFVELPILAPEKGFPFVERRASVLVWTTTPWTLPANMGVAFHPDLEYVLEEVSLEAGVRSYLLARARLEDTLKALGAKGHRRVGSWTGKELVEGAAIACSTPFAHLPQARHKVSRGVLAGYVSAEDGTGVVHTAPGHGIDDFNTGRAAGLDIFCPVDGAGRFTAEAGPFEGLRIFEEGNPAVLEALRLEGRLAAKGSITHSYPHCWRCKNPIAFRATEQWFLDVGHAGLREKLLKAVEEVVWIPAAGKERIAAMVSSRPDWCISRQRLWGTPIPMVRCRDCSAALDREAADALIAAVAAKVREEGSDFWFADPGKPVVRSTVGCAAGEVLAWDFLPEFRCPRCSGKVFLRETDILDVWVDSGASWLGVLGAEGVPCDLYLEGSDQHRGWFQSSLVLAVAAAGKAPYRAVLTHGFVLDDQGRAMHKSLGNVVSPRQVVDRLGADVLRLWTALSDYSDDVRLSEKLLEGPVDSYRKLRNTFRYLLGNIDDFDPARDAVPLARLGELERTLLDRLRSVDREVRGAYSGFAFRKAATALVDFCNLGLSAFYLDARKDALYTLKADDPLRRGAQTVMWECLLRLLRLSSPILSFTCEEAWQELRRSLRERASAFQPAESVFLQDLGEAPAAWTDEVLRGRWEDILRVREAVLAVLEKMRAAKEVGSSLQGRVVLSAGGELSHAFLTSLGPEAWAELCIVSDAEIRLMSASESERLLKSAAGAWAELVVLSESPAEAVHVSVEKARGVKCPRCWRYRTDGGLFRDDPELCARCARQLV